MWWDVLRKLNAVIAENENGIKVSLRKRKEYLRKMKVVPMDSAALDNVRTKQQAAVVTAPAPKETQHRAASSATSMADAVESAEPEMGDSLHENLLVGTEEDFSLPDEELEEDEEAEPTTPVESSRNAAAAVDANGAKANSATPTTPEHTRVVVSGFENGDEDDLLRHFSKFGAILDKEFDNAVPSATLVYDNRESAEEAKKGRNFRDRLLSVTVHASKKFRPCAGRPTNALKAQEYAPVAAQMAAANPYEYKNPQVTAPKRARRRRRRKSKAQLAREKEAPPSLAVRAAATDEFAEEEAPLGDDNLMENSD